MFTYTVEIYLKYLETQQNICLNTLFYRMYAFKNFFIAQLYPYTIFWGTQGTWAASLHKRRLDFLNSLQPLCNEIQNKRRGGAACSEGWNSQWIWTLLNDLCWRKNEQKEPDSVQIVFSHTLLVPDDDHTSYNWEKLGVCDGACGFRPKHIN